MFAQLTFQPLPWPSRFHSAALQHAQHAQQHSAVGREKQLSSARDEDRRRLRELLAALVVNQAVGDAPVDIEKSGFEEYELLTEQLLDSLDDFADTTTGTWRERQASIAALQAAIQAWAAVGAHAAGADSLQSHSYASRAVAMAQGHALLVGASLPVPDRVGAEIRALTSKARACLLNERVAHRAEAAVPQQSPHS